MSSPISRMTWLYQLAKPSPHRVHPGADKAVQAVCPASSRTKTGIAGTENPTVLGTGIPSTTFFEDVETRNIIGVIRDLQVQGQAVLSSALPPCMRLNAPDDTWAYIN